jgi:hypothetical protein
MRAVRTWAAAIVVVGMASACRLQLQESFTCTGDSSCGPGGTCEANGFCSFPDSACPSGRRYGDLGGSGQCVGGQPPPDAGPGAPADARVCFGTAPFTFCFMTPPAGAIDVSIPTTLDTVNGTMTGIQLNCATSMSGDEGNNYCVLAANTITINAPLRATGTKPLVLLAVDSINVANTIDVGSHRMGATDSSGAGADPTGSGRCNAGIPPSAVGGTSGGGGGGSFIGSGGNGANGGGGNGGAHGSVTPLGTVLRGGCPGQNGAGLTPGKGGHGGGAVFLIAGNSITVGGMILAGGEGGEAGTGPGDGGGGGGTGGLIGFDAMSITVTGTLIANGGGGGGGASGSGTDGGPGGDADSTSAAPGGNGGGTSGGNGGAGSAGPAGGSGVIPGDATGGGGGGGGGAGLIKGPPASLGTKLSPAATP